MKIIFLLFTLLTFFLTCVKATPTNDVTSTPLSPEDNSIATNTTILQSHDPISKAAAFGGGCYPKGNAPGNIDWVNRNILYACQTVFGGRYDQHTSGRWRRSACYNTFLDYPDPRSYWVAVDNMVNYARDLDPYGCETYMKKISNDCSRGGVTIYYGWKFRIDPERRAGCVDISYLDG